MTTCASIRQTDEVGAELALLIKMQLPLLVAPLRDLGMGTMHAPLSSRADWPEMVRFGMYFGGDMATYMGLTGLGDLIVTCNSQHSRNFQAGYQIGKEDSAAKFLSENTKTVEGVRTTKIIHEVAKNLSIKTPIIDAIYSVIYEQKRPSETIKLLMNRPLKSED